jgi:prevent-host-death family protein
MLTATRPDVAEGIDSLTNFKRDSGPYLARLRETGAPLILTVNGKPQAVLLAPDAYQELLDRLDQYETVRAVRQSMTSFRRGLGKPAKQALAALRKKHRIAEDV